jgi:hypothetical protein
MVAAALPLGRQQLLLSNLMPRSGQFRLKASSETALLCLQYSLDHLLAKAAIKRDYDCDTPCMDPTGRGNKVQKIHGVTHYHKLLTSDIFDFFLQSIPYNL